MCKAAQPGKYDKEIQRYFEKAEEARKLEEDRVQIDETVEKKDLVAGSLAAITTSVTLPVLRESPPDVASCLPYRALKLRAVDAFYCCWMDCCFTCGSSGATDTFLHCVDCGEAFHSFCVNAPIHSMELTSAAGWRCPNCKICEISGDVPQDETRMLFCDMCDRAFSLDLLDPPLKKAPPGLWICGQCVDCKTCKNRSEPKGASRSFWSRDPDKCFRCGGCEGLLKDYTTKMKCQVCCGLLRKDDTDVVDCTECGAKIHTSCDDLADDCRRHDELLSKSKRIAPYVSKNGLSFHGSRSQRSS
jgi:PHD-finger